MSSEPAHTNTDDTTGGHLWLVAACGIALLTALTIFRDPLAIHLDIAAYLDIGRRILDGQLPYADFTDANPPLVFYLHAVPVWLADAAGTHPIVAFKILVLAILGGSCVLTWTAMRANNGFNARTTGFVVAAWAFATYLVSEAHLGQREHLFALALLPYIIVRLRRQRGEGIPLLVALTTGLAAGLFGALKPHFLILLAIPDIWWLYRHRRLTRPAAEGWSVVGVLAAYALALIMLPEAVRTAMQHEWFPMMTHGYAAYDRPLWTVMTDRYALVGLLFGIVALARPSTRDEGTRDLLQTLGVVTVVAYGLFVAQHKGWQYHRLPVMLPAFLIVAVSAREVAVQAWESRRRPRVAAAFAVAGMLLATALLRPDIVAGVALLLVPATFAVIRVRRDLTAVTGGAVAVLILTMQAVAAPPDSAQEWRSDPLEPVLSAYTREGDQVLVVSTSVGGQFPILAQMERRTGSRYPWTFPLALTYWGTHSDSAKGFPYQRREFVSEEERRILADLGAYVGSTPPPLILVHNGPRSLAMPDGFNVLDWLEGHRFIGQHMTGYRRVADIIGESEEARFAVFIRTSKTGG